MRAMPIPMPAFAPVERPMVCEIEDVEGLVGEEMGVTETVRVRAWNEVVDEEGELDVVVRGEVEVRGEPRGEGVEEEEVEGEGEGVKAEEGWFGSGEEIEGEGDGELKG
jgi:hypothetical protein